MRESIAPALIRLSSQFDGAVWAWGAGRLPELARIVTRAAVILPFEEQLLRGYGINATFVGHPLLDRASDLPSKPAARAALGLPAAAFVVGLLQAQWTFTGYDASAHISEETRDPTRNAPWGIFLSVAVSAVVGYVLLGAVTLAIQDLPAAVATTYVAPPFLSAVATPVGLTSSNVLSRAV